MPTCRKCGKWFGIFTDRWQKICIDCHYMEFLARDNNFVMTTRDRCNEILRFNNVNQDRFGICGMSSALHVLIEGNKHRARELAAATFFDYWPTLLGPDKHKDFRTGTQGLVHIDLKYLLRRHTAAWHADRAAAARAAGANAMAVQAATVQSETRLVGYFADYCVSRAIGYLFRECNYSLYKTEKKSIGEAFWRGDVGGRKGHTRSGDLALQPASVEYILKDILGAVAMHVSTRTGAGDETRLLNRIQTLLNGGRFVLAAVDTTCVGGHPTHLWNGYNHWVVIKDVDIPGRRLSIWTWGEQQAYDAPAAPNNWATYITHLVAGRF